jgi:hypothetical protein
LSSSMATCDGCRSIYKYTITEARGELGVAYMRVPHGPYIYNSTWHRHAWRRGTLVDWEAVRAYRYVRAHTLMARWYACKSALLYGNERCGVTFCTCFTFRVWPTIR